jgi:hypothetical protein
MSEEEYALAEKFAHDWHLNVAERKMLAGKPLSGAKLADCIARILEAKGVYPPDWTLDTGFDGGLIQRIGPQEFKVTWKAEVGMCRFEVVGTDLFRSAREACLAYGSRFFGKEFDGIPIDWRT